jgi:predicted MFS family arabinose efflux permease
MSIMPNLALYASQRTGRAAGALVGFMLAARFGAKAVAGGYFGYLAEKKGTPAALIALDIFLLTALTIASFATGYHYLAAFAFLGGAELGGIYHPNYCLSISRDETGARNVSVLMIVASLASIGSAISGLLSDLIGFRASFLFAALCAVAALILIRQLPAEQSVSEPSNL